MNRQEWIALAQALQTARLEIEAIWPPRWYNAFDPGVAEQRLVREARLDGLDRAARKVCSALRSRSSRFDETRFMSIVNGHPKR